MFAAIILSAAAVGAQRTFTTPNWSGAFDDDSGVLQSLRPTLDPSFDFLPSDVFASRNGVGNYHTGDLTFRWRLNGQTAWEEVDTAAQRTSTPSSVNASDSILESSFDNIFSNSSSRPVSVTRNWREVDGDLILEATIQNSGNSSPVELGAFGFPIEVNSIFTGRSAVDTSNKCVLADPYIGRDAGYVQVTRLLGTGPSMVITPYGNASRFEAWRFLSEPSTEPLRYQSQTFEGHYSWQMLSTAYAENEWNATEPWNEPTSATLEPGQNITFGLRFSAVADIPSIETAVASTGTPVAVGLPGYILPADMVGKLFLKSKCPVASITSHPNGALTFTPSTARSNEWAAFDVTTAGGHGRVRADITYEDGRTQTVHYFITDSAPNQLRRHANFLFTDSYLEGPDAFNRTPGIITYDWEARAKVEQERRVWVAGLQDEGGAASYAAAALKTAYHPTAEEVRKLEEMATQVFWGGMQYNTTDDEWPMYTVKRSLFFHDPEALPDYPYADLDWSGWPSWNRTESRQVWRPYNYVWVSALYWSLYHAEKVSPGVLTLKNATWYLDKAYHTTKVWYDFLPDGHPISEFRDVGYMGEIVWLEILKDLQAEGLTAEFESIRAIMQDRQRVWAGRPDPFGSEMAWDSTGQEGVYTWSKYFDDDATVQKTLESIRGYMPTVAHWAWNGNARRYWDFDIAGKIARIERQVHHYGSPLNAIPLLDHYKYAREPAGAQAFYDLRVGYGGWLGALSNINEAGFAGQAFHAWPETMEWDGYSSDYGCGLTGHFITSATYLVEHPEFGLVSMGGNLDVSSDDDGIATVRPRDTVRRSIYVASVGLRFEIDVGTIESFTYDAGARSVRINVVATEGENGNKAQIRWEDTIGSGVTTGQGETVSIPGSVEYSW